MMVLVVSGNFDRSSNEGEAPGTEVPGAGRRQGRDLHGVPQVPPGRLDLL